MINIMERMLLIKQPFQLWTPGHDENSVNGLNDLLKRVRKV